MLSKYWKLLCFILFSPIVYATCPILNSKEQPARPQYDPLYLLLQSESDCTDDVFKFRRWLKQVGLTLKTTMVANRGFHNPSEGSFSLFEMVTGDLHQNTIKTGDFFFGHFTTLDANDHLTADQNPQKDSLMIEAFAWDDKKGAFNFYELRGNGKNGQWFYRGDSLDILADNTLLHRQPDPNHPAFGERLRCSACHGAGGPIMKEIYPPHNDWWEPDRPLDFGGKTFDSSLEEILTTLVSADSLATAVNQGIKKLNRSPLFYEQVNSLSLQEQLRPLFCPVELNFNSDVASNDQNSPYILIPTEFFIDSRLLPPHYKSTITISRNHYNAALKTLGSHFPETKRQDSDHAWLTPVKAKSDKRAIKSLISHGLIDKKFVADVLAIDMTNPVFSPTRCHLLQYLPRIKTMDWRNIFIANLARSSDATAKQLIDNLTNPEHTLHSYQKQAETLLNQCQTKLKAKAYVELMMRLLIQRRAEIRVSEISANPKGQILEPGFRVIFPENSEYTPIANRLKLMANCELFDT